MIRPSRDQAFALFAQQGEDHVRLTVQNFNAVGASSGSKMLNRYAIEWLAQFEKESRLRNEPSQSESLETAKSAKDAAWEAANAARAAAREAKNANVIASLALTGAVIAIAISVVGLFVGK